MGFDTIEINLVDTIDNEKFEFVPCVQFFMDFQYKTLKDTPSLLKS